MVAIAPDVRFFRVGCCDGYLINEGDLDGNGTDEITVFQSPVNGCTYRFRTFTCRNGEWTEIIGHHLYPTGCEGYTAEELDDLVSLKDGKVQVTQREVTEWVLFKKKVTLK